MRKRRQKFSFPTCVCAGVHYNANQPESNEMTTENQKKGSNTYTKYKKTI